MSAVAIIDTRDGSTASSPASCLPQYSITCISNRDYLIHAGNIYEIQSVSPNGGKYASFMVGSRFVSNPDLHVMTRVDPLYFVLDYLETASTNINTDNGGGAKWQPFDQLLKDLPKPVLTALNTNLSITTVKEVGQLAHLMDVSDLFDDDIVCKFNETKALAWLNAKYERSLVSLRGRKLEKKRRMEERKSSGEYGAFSSSFVLAGTESSKDKTESTSNTGKDAKEVELTKDEEHAVRISALQLISEYIPPSWRTKLAKSLNLSEEDIEKKTKATSAASGEKRPRASWEGVIGQAEADELLCLTTGQSNTTSVTPAEKSAKNAQTVGLKRLAKVNTKGMKSINSFFGGAKKKA
jgi:hypothetical protein